MLRAEAQPYLVLGSAFEVRRFASLALILVDQGVERLSLSDGLRRIRVDIVSGTVFAGPVALRFLITEDEHGASQLLALSQFRALRQTGNFAAALHRPDARAGRWVQQLRAFDAVEVGANTYEIAAALFPARTPARRWREDDSLRSTVRRLIAGAKAMVEGGYLKLLR